MGDSAIPGCEESIPKEALELEFPSEKIILQIHGVGQAFTSTQDPN